MDKYRKPNLANWDGRVPGHLPSARGSLEGCRDMTAKMAVLRP